MDAFNKLASALLKVAVGISVVIGTISLASRPSDTPEPHKIIHVKKTSKANNLKRLAEFLEKLQEQEEAAEKKAGPE
jgi:hypothetical protein